MISKFRWTEFRNVFRSEFISNEPVQHNPLRKSQEIEQPRKRSPLSSTYKSRSATSIPWRPNKSTEAYPTPVAVGKTSVSGELIVPSESKPFEFDQDNDLNCVDLSAEQRRTKSSALSKAFLGKVAPPRSSTSPVAAEVTAALITYTNERLRESPKSLDFGVVKQRVEQKLGLTSNFWGQDEYDEWFFKSKNIIKMVVVSYRVMFLWCFTDKAALQEDWVERTNNPPPKNATWMLRFFNSTDESPSSIMKDPSSAIWRTKEDSGLQTRWVTTQHPSACKDLYRIPQHTKRQQPPPHRPKTKDRSDWDWELDTWVAPKGMPNWS